MDVIGKIKSENFNIDIVDPDLCIVKITVFGELSLASLLAIENYFSKVISNEKNYYVIIDLRAFISIAFKAKQYIFGKDFFPEKGIEIIVFGLNPAYSANLHLLFHSDSNINVFEFENEFQALTKANELSSKAKMDSLAIGPSSFTGIIKKNIKIKGKDYVMVHDKSWNYQHPIKTYYYRIDLVDANIFISRPAGYIELENSLSANVLFDKVAYKLIGSEAHYYRIQDYTEVMSSSLSARRDFTNYIINNIDRIDLMVFYGLNSFMKAIVKFGKLIHPKFYKVKIADSFEDAMAIVLNHKYGKDFFEESLDVDESQSGDVGVMEELEFLRKENHELKAASVYGKRKLLEAIGGVLWSDDFEMENALDSPTNDYLDVYNALKVLKQDIKEINQKREDSTNQLLRQTQRLTKEVKDSKVLAYQNNKQKKDYYNMFNFEIHSPFQSILSNVELLSKINKKEEHKEIISQIMESSLLINKRLKKHFEVGNHNFEKNDNSTTVFNVDKTIQLVMNAHLEHAISKGLSLVFEKDEKVPVYLIGDEDKLRLIIEQFVDNAICFTDHGNVIIRTKLIEDYETSAKISIEIEDTGIGMTQDEFDKLRSGDSIHEKEEINAFQNQGVGLILLKQLADVINGEIGMKSANGKGSIFSVQVKFNKGVFSREMNLKPRTSVKNHLSIKLKEKRLLFILEDSSLKSVYLSQFDQIGIQVKFANNETHASSLLKSSKFDFILIGAPIQQSIGHRLLNLVLENLTLQKEENAKIVFVMSTPDIEYRDEILNNGCHAIINKPYQIIELKKLLESLIA